MLSNWEIHFIPLYEARLSCTTVEATQNITTTWRNCTTFERRTNRWFKQVCADTTSLESEEDPEHSLEDDDDQLKVITKIDLLITTRTVGEELSINYSTMFHYFKLIRKMKRFYKCVLCIFKEKVQKKCRNEVCSRLLSTKATCFLIEF